MSCMSDLRFASAIALPLCLLLSACDEGTTNVASIPSPPHPKPTPTPTPTPTPKPVSLEVQTTWLPSPTTTAGSYGVVGLVNQTVAGNSSGRMATPVEFQLLVSQPSPGSGFNYQIENATGFLPAGLTKIFVPVQRDSWIFNLGGPNYRVDNPYEDYVQLLGQNLKEYEVYSDGTKVLREDYNFVRSAVSKAIVDLPSGERIAESSLLDVGLSYVAMGEWNWGSVKLNADGSSTPTGDTSSIYFAFGDRTPPSEIPISGTATYDARTLGQQSSSGFPFSLNADFAQRSISTQISQGTLFSVSGSALFQNNGSFGIPLAGTAGPLAATGTMNGAFFGPHAEQVGGVFSVQGTGGGLILQDAFVGQQRP